MKLNNKGFGMGTLIFFICLFFVILLAVTYIAYTNGIEKKDNNSNSIPEIREPVDEYEGRDTSESSN